MAAIHDFDRNQMLALTPVIYLKDGLLDAQGRLRPEMKGLCATAGAIQLEASETSPQELRATLEALKQVLPHYEVPPSTRLQDAAADALEVVRDMYHIQNNPGIVKWLLACIPAVRTEPDVDAFLQHFEAVVRIYGVIVAMTRLGPCP